MAMQKYNSIPRVGKAQGLFRTGQIWIDEKMDGANFRFALGERFDVESEFDSGLIYGSKNVEFHDPENLNKSFRHAVEFVEENVDIEYVQQFYENNNEDYIFYGEAMHPHTMHYVDDVPSFLGFEVYRMEEECFMHPDMRDYIYNNCMNLPTVPTIEREVPVDEFSLEKFEFPESEYWDEEMGGPKIEGIVIRNPETGSRAKYRTEEFMEVHSTSGQVKNDTTEVDDAVVLADKFATEARIKKEIHKMRDEGYEVEMEMMEYLWERVFDDIIDEEYDTILKSNYEFSTKDFRSRVAGNCAQVLQNILRRPEGSIMNEVHNQSSGDVEA